MHTLSEVYEKFHGRNVLIVGPHADIPKSLIDSWNDLVTIVVASRNNSESKSYPKASILIPRDFEWYDGFDKECSLVSGPERNHRKYPDGIPYKKHKCTESECLGRAGSAHWQRDLRTVIPGKVDKSSNIHLDCLDTLTSVCSIASWLNPPSITLTGYPLDSNDIKNTAQKKYIHLFSSLHTLYAAESQSRLSKLLPWSPLV